MGIGSNWAVEVAEEEYREQMIAMVAEQAAIMIVGGESREFAISRAKDIVSDEYNPHLPIPAGKEAQVHAIQAKLISSDMIELD